MIANQVRALALAVFMALCFGRPTLAFSGQGPVEPQELPEQQPQDQAPDGSEEAAPSDDDEEQAQRPARRAGILPLTVAAEADLGSRFAGPALHHQGAIVITTVTGEVVSLDAATLETRWKLGMPRAELFPPFLLPGGILVATRSGNMELLDPDTGAIVGEMSLGVSLAAPPSWDGERLFLATEDRDVLAYDVDKREEIWRARLQDPGLRLTPRAPLLLVSDRTGGLHALEAATGALRWQFQGRGTFEAPPTFDEAQERLYLGDTGGYFYSLSAHDGGVHYRWALGAAIADSVLIEEDRLFVVSYANTLFCYRTGNGHELWRANLPGRPATAPFRVRRRIVVLTLNGQVVEFAAGGQPSPQFYAAPDDILPYPLLLPQGMALPLRSGRLLLLQTRRGGDPSDGTEPEELQELDDEEGLEDPDESLDGFTDSSATL